MALVMHLIRGCTAQAPPLEEDPFAKRLLLPDRALTAAAEGVASKLAAQLRAKEAPSEL